jgi:hypothetical protein
MVRALNRLCTAGPSCRARGECSVPLRLPAFRMPPGLVLFIACAPSPCGPALPVARLAGRHPGDYYGHSVAIGLASRRRSHVHNCRTYLARLRRPVRLLQCPDRASLLRPGGFPQVAPNLATEAGAGFRRLSGGCNFSPSGDWASGSPAFAISRGPPGTPPRTPGHDYRFPGMLLSPSPYGSS